MKTPTTRRHRSARDRRLQRAAVAGARAKDRGSQLKARRRGLRGAPTLRCTTSATTRAPLVDRRSPAQVARCGRAARLRPAPPGCRMTLVAIRRRILDAMQREAGAVGRMLAHGVIDGPLPPIWESRAHEFPLTGEVLTYDRSITLRRTACTGAGYAGPCGGSRNPPGLHRRRPRPDLPTGRFVVGCFGHLTPAKRVPHCKVHASAGARSGGAAAPGRCALAGARAGAAGGRCAP